MDKEKLVAMVNWIHSYHVSLAEGKYREIELEGSDQLVLDSLELLGNVDDFGIA